VHSRAIYLDETDSTLGYMTVFLLLRLYRTEAGGNEIVSYGWIGRYVQTSSRGLFNTIILAIYGRYRGKSRKIQTG